MPKIKALFLAANPGSTKRLAIDEEMHAIEQKLRAAEHRNALVFQSAWAVRPDDLLQLLNQHQPHIVHFSGHGSGAGLSLAGDDGRDRLVTTRALKMLFTTLKDNIGLVVLNACYSREQAQALVEIIDCVIGMKESIGDDAATAFASSFYRAIGFGRSIQAAFEQGVTSLLLEGIAEEEIPELLVKDGVDPNQIVLAGRLTVPLQNPHKEPSNKKPQILIIDDERIWQDQLRDILEDQMGYHADIAGDLTTAKQLWDAPTHYDLALVDACLDQEDFTLPCQQFLAYLHTKHPEVPLVAITGKPIIGRRAFILSMYGVADFIEKGKDDLPDIQQRITRCLSKANPNSHIFISYRHGSGAEYAWRLYDHLTSHFGKSNVLIDIYQADEDTDSASDIQTALEKCQTILVVIGQQWTSMTDKHGYQLLSNENDHVRREVSSALKRNMRIIPVLVENATLPQKKDLPDDLRGLTDYQAVSIVNPRDLHEPLQYLISLCKGEPSHDKHQSKAQRRSMKSGIADKSRNVKRKRTQAP